MGKPVVANGRVYPRGVGLTKGELRGGPFVAGTRSYTLYMLQRVVDAVAGLDAAERKQVDEALAGTGWEEVIDYTPRHRVGKDHFQLVEVAQRGQG